MIRIGLTGGIGSGKTVVSTLLGVMGIPVYDSDDRTKELYDSDESLKAALTARFGESLYAEGRLNRSLLASIIFTDIEALSFINKVVHPIVEADYRKWAEQQKAPYVVQESAILFEAGLAPLCDLIVVVSAPDDLRVQRVCQRNGCTPDSVRERKQWQLKEEERLAHADRVLVNDDVKALIPQVISLQTYLKQLIVN
jgi:dephospho-CoA kinase